MPDFLKMTSTGKSGRGQDSLNQPYGKSSKSDPFNETTLGRQSPRLTVGLVKTLNHMSNKIGINNRTLLSEGFKKEEDQNGEA